MSPGSDLSCPSPQPPFPWKWRVADVEYSRETRCLAFESRAQRTCAVDQVDRDTRDRHRKVITTWLPSYPAVTMTRSNADLALPLFSDHRTDDLTISSSDQPSAMTVEASSYAAAAFDVNEAFQRILSDEQVRSFSQIEAPDPQSDCPPRYRPPWPLSSR